MPLPSRLWRPCLSLAGCLILTATLTAALLAVRGPAGEPSRAAYDRIKMGMPRGEAETVLGDWPRQLVRRNDGAVTFAWEAPDGATIEVDFDSRGRVTGKQIAADGRPFRARVERFIKHLLP
jgi:hypothetical protein